MTYAAYEESVHGGRPFFMYQFARRATTTRLAASKDDVTFDGDTWLKSSVTHDTLEQTGDVERNELELQLPISDTFAFNLLQPQTTVMTLTIFRGHRDDPDQEKRMYWKGRIVGPVSEESIVKIKTENVFTSLRRPGCRVRVQRTCRHDLYGLECTLDLTDFAVACTITAMVGLNITVPVAAGFTDGEYKAGMIKWNDEFGFISSHVGSSLRLVAEIPGLEEALSGGGQAATIYRGCNRNLVSANGCSSFGNQLNFGGFRWIPQYNPFNSSIV